MCLSKTCHTSCQLVTTSEEEFKVLIYLLLEMSLGIKADMVRRGKGEKTGETAQCCSFRGQKSSLILVSLLICSCSARWTARMINGCEITKDVMGRKVFFLICEGKLWEKDAMKSDW